MTPPPPERKNDDKRPKTGEIRPLLSPVAQEQTMALELAQRKSMIEQYLVKMQGKKLEPDQTMQLFSDLLKQMRSEAGEAERSRYAEVQNAYLFLEYYQSLLSGEVKLVLSEKFTESIMSLLGWLGDIGSRGNMYEESKQRWWGRTVNRPDRNETQSIRNLTLNSSDASFVERFAFNRAADWLTNEDPNNTAAKNQVVAAYAYEFLRDLVVVRRTEITPLKTGEERTLPFAAIAKKDRYTIIIYDGPFVRKISVPAELIEDASKFNEFHMEFRKCLTEKDPKLESFTTSPWGDTRGEVARSYIAKATKKGLSGTEEIHDAKKRRNNPKDITAADLSVTIARSDEMTIDQLQQDFRSDTYGAAVPIALTFGINPDGRMTSFATKHAHPYTDGAEAVKRTETITNTVFEQHLQRAPSSRGEIIDPPLARMTQSENRKYQPTVWEKPIPRDKYVARISVLREYFKSHAAEIQQRDPRMTPELIEGLRKGINIQNLLAISVMVAFRHDHAHFLESVDLSKAGIPKASEVAPAIAVLTPKLRERILASQEGPPFEEVLFDLMTIVGALDGSRMMTRRGQGPAQIFDVILGPQKIKDSMQFGGSFLDPKKAEMLTNSTMFSPLIGGEQPWSAHKVVDRQTGKLVAQPNEYLSLQGFTTAAADTYPDEVFGACDRVNQETGENEILLTLRRRQKLDSATKDIKKILVNPKAMENIEAILERILKYFEDFMNEVQFRPLETTRETIMKRPLNFPKDWTPPKE